MTIPTLDNLAKRRYAQIANISVEQAAAYLPDNYEVVTATPNGSVIITGIDNAGWTLDDYVLPRLASGSYFGEEIPADHAPNLIAGCRRELSDAPQPTIYSN